ncbi:hypothetical protein BHE74_00058158 [Ensete ventricosum]|nr:hypothetical protein BHE74_00058158 [Ensete ventricosum]
MSQERPFGNSGAEHHPEPNHPQPIEEVTAAAPTPNRFWRMMTDLGFFSPASNPAPFVVTTEAFLGLTSQVQALTGMVQTIVPYLPKLMHSITHQPAPPTAHPQTESPVAPNWGAPLETELPRRQVAEACAASPTPALARSQSRPAIRRRSLSQEGRSEKALKAVLHSPPRLQDKPLPATFRLPTLEPYDGSDDPTEHIAAFRTQMALYDTTETVEVLLVTNRATARNATEDAATSASIHGRRDVGGEQAGRDEAPPGGAAPRTPPVAALNSTRTEIFFQIQEKGLLKAPNPMKSHSERRNKRRYYHFHREYGHDTKECSDLQYQIEDLIRRGHLRRYVRDQSSLPDSRPPRNLSPRPKGPIEKQIDVIFGGPTSGGDSSSACKAYARSEVGKRPTHVEDLDITFKLGGEEFPCHDDALVISIRMANAYVKRVMIDTKSSTDILYFDAFQKLGLTDKYLVTLTSTLTGFTGDFVSPVGVIAIPVTFGRESRSKTLMVSFMVVKLSSAYNAIIGRPTLNRLKTVVSTYHRLLKFPTRAGVGEVRSDPRESKQCYLAATTLSKKPKTQSTAVVP